MNQTIRRAWQELYELSLKIGELKPWSLMADSDLLVISQEKTGESFVTSIMGNADECYGIGIYPSIDSQQLLNSVFTRQSSSIVDSLSYPPAQMSALCAYWGDRVEVSKENYRVIKNLGYRFRGHNKWLYFVKYSIGEFPSDLSLGDVKYLIGHYKILLDVIEDIITGKIMIDRLHEKSVYISLDSKNRIIDSTLDNYHVPENVPTYVKFKDELLIQRLKKSQRINTTLEVTYFYIPVPTQKDSNQLIATILGVDSDIAQIVFTEIVGDKTKILKLVIESITGYIQDIGIPRKIKVRLIDIESELADFCFQLGIMLISDQDLPTIENIVGQLPIF